MHLLHPPLSFLRLPFHYPAAVSSSPCMYVRAKTKKCELLPYTRRPPLVSGRPFPISGDRSLCPGAPSLYSATVPCAGAPLSLRGSSPWCPGTSSPYKAMAPCIRRPFHTCGNSHLCGGARSLYVATSPRVRKLCPYNCTPFP